MPVAYPIEPTPHSSHKWIIRRWSQTNGLGGGRNPPGPRSRDGRRAGSIAGRRPDGHGPPEDRGLLLVVAATTGEFKVERRGVPPTGRRVRLAARHGRGRGRAHGPRRRRAWASRWMSSGVVAKAALLVPLVLPRPLDRRPRRLRPPRDAPEFGAEDESLLMGFAASAAMALAAAQSMAEARLRESHRRRRARAGALGARAPRRDAPGPRRAPCPSRPRRCGSTTPRWARRLRPRLPRSRTRSRTFAR